MGGFYGSMLIRTEDVAMVRTALEAVARELEAKFLLSPPITGWTAVFPHGHGQEPVISEALAEKIGAPLLHCLVHDDDVFVYRFYEGGKLIDSYNSCPAYFGGKPEPRGGNVEALHSLLPEGEQRARLQELLDRDDFNFEIERLDKIAELLSLPNAVGAYEYLQDDERDGIQQWKKFAHIPDLAAERAAKRAAKAKVKADMKRLASEDVLIRETVGAKAKLRGNCLQPIWCISAPTNTVLKIWCGDNPGGVGPAQLFSIDARSGKKDDTGLELSYHVFSMALSPSGRWLSVGLASGDWQTQLWDMEARIMVREFPQSRAVGAVRFGPDERTLFSLSEDTITVIDVRSAAVVGTVKLPEFSRALAVHPGKEFLAAAWGGMLAVVHIPTRTVTRSRWILNPSDPRCAGFKEQIASKPSDGACSEVNLDAAEADLRDEVRRLPKLGVNCLEFSPDGTLLICGTFAGSTAGGVCILDWNEVLNGPDLAPLTARQFAEGEPQELDEDGLWTLTPCVCAVSFDDKRQRVLFAGLEGKVRFLDLETNRTGDLLVPPLRLPFRHLEMTPDRTALVGTVTASNRHQKEPPKFQIWSYPALCKAAGLDW